jgi:hypothetical protein
VKLQAQILRIRPGLHEGGEDIWRPGGEGTPAAWKKGVRLELMRNPAPRHREGIGRFSSGLDHVPLQHHGTVPGTRHGERGGEAANAAPGEDELHLHNLAAHSCRKRGLGEPRSKHPGQSSPTAPLLAQVRRLSAPYMCLTSNHSDGGGPSVIGSSP